MDDLTIHKDGQSDPIPYPEKLFKRLLPAVSERTRLAMLLMANCGMTQKDISDLQHSQVDWADGRVIRKRSKTKTEKTVPTVNYKLWPETFALLKKCRSAHPKLVLLNEDGGTLKTEGYAGKLKKSDCIGRQYKRDCKVLGIEHSEPLKRIKKLSCTLLEDEFDEATSTYFLGQSPRSIKDKHYKGTGKPVARFDAALEWLGKRLLA